jgi:urease accessory protein
MRIVLLLLLPALYVVIALLMAATITLVLLTAPKGHIVLDGMGHPIFGLDHFLALTLVGIWAGRLRGLELWALPLSFVAGIALGFGLGAYGPTSAVEMLIHLVMLASTVFLAVAALLTLRLLRLNMIIALALLGICHGYTDRVEASSAEPWLFGGGLLASATTLLALAVVVGRVIPQATRESHGVPPPSDRDAGRARPLS